CSIISTRTRVQRAAPDQSRNAVAASSVQTPASTPTPRASSASATTTAPGSCQFTEAKSGSTVHEATVAARSPGSGSIQAPVLTPTGSPGQAARTAATAAATSAAAMLS